VKFSFNGRNQQLFILQSGIAYQFTRVHKPAKRMAARDRNPAKLYQEILHENAETRTETYRSEIPIGMVTASASGLDPHISPAAAYAQAARIAGLRNMAEGDLWAVINAHIEGRTFSVLGEPRVNVLKLNLALDALPPRDGAVE
jgi:K+-transporting ATPase c subunit